MRYKETKLNLEFVKDLKQKMPCPTCKKDLEYPKYKCANCKIQLVFYVGTK